MENLDRNSEIYYEAKQKVKKIKEFYANLTSYIIFNIFFLVLNLVTSPNHLWFYWPLLWWGVGVFFHGMKVFDYYPLVGKNWEERKIKELMEKEKNKQKWS